MRLSEVQRATPQRNLAQSVVSASLGLPPARGQNPVRVHKEKPARRRARCHGTHAKELARAAYWFRPYSYRVGWLWVDTLGHAYRPLGGLPLIQSPITTAVRNRPARAIAQRRCRAPLRRSLLSYQRDGVKRRSSCSIATRSSKLSACGRRKHHVHPARQ